jgi:hypothetical protein
MPSRNEHIDGRIYVLSIHASDDFCNLGLNIFIRHCFYAVSLILSESDIEDISGFILGEEGIEVLPGAVNRLLAFVPGKAICVSDNEFTCRNHG